MVLRMRAVELNYRDLAIARGHYHVAVSPPLVPLSDGAGEVVSIGSKVRRVRVGELACPVYLPDWIDGPISPRVGRRRLGGPSDGVLAEMMCLNEQDVVRAPAHLDAAEAATLAVTAVTAWHSLYEIGNVAPGEAVSVQGSGGVSTAALQFARAGGARVIAVVRGERHATALRRLGAAEESQPQFRITAAETETVPRTHVAYVPVGSVKAGRELVNSRGAHWRSAVPSRAKESGAMSCG
jgi:NADPH:quinone reductase-like Zn-dependent oxidoreductase